MYKIGIIGSTEDRFKQPKRIRRYIDDIITLLGFQYNNDVVFNVMGDIGVGLWTIDMCIDNQLRHHLFLPSTVENTSCHWYTEQQHLLEKGYSNAHSISICNNSDVYKRLIDYSNFVICFWAGNKQGEIYESILYAMHNNKMILNGLDKLRMMTRDGIK